VSLPTAQTGPALSRKILALQGGAETSFTRMLRLAAQTPNLISLGRGDPDVPTPPHIVEAAVKTLQSRHVNYTPPPGLPALREAIAEKLSRENGLDYAPFSEVLVTCGAQEAISVIMQTLLDPGDEVLLPDPFYTAYEMAIGLAHGVVVHVPTYAEQDFEVQPSAIAARITSRTRMIVLVSPSNPTGGVISTAALQKIADLAIRHNLIVVSDELYEKVLFDGAEAPSIARLPGMRERTIIINGFSKTYCMTGFRVGYLAGPAPLIGALQEPHHIFTICAPTPSQHAALAALRGDQGCVEEIVGIFARRRQALLSSLRAEGIPFPHPSGAFFAFGDIRATGMSSADFAVKVLEEAGVLVFPGTQYGPCGEGFLRISYLAEIPDIERSVAALGRIYREACR
jgi:aspartate/methionine/tyrosine aminotransferase